MQRTDLIIQNRDITPLQRGASEGQMHYSAEPAVTHKFHYTPNARRRKLNAARVQATTQTVVAQQQSSARSNAFVELQNREQRQFTPQEVQGYAQWILQADRLLESMRLDAEGGIA